MRAGCGALKTKGDIPRARADPTPVHSHAHAIQPPPPSPRKAVVSATGMVDPDALVGTGKPPTAGAVRHLLFLAARWLLLCHISKWLWAPRMAVTCPQLKSCPVKWCLDMSPTRIQNTACLGEIAIGILDTAMILCCCSALRISFEEAAVRAPSGTRLYLGSAKGNGICEGECHLGGCP